MLTSLPETLLPWLHQYGSFALFVLLALGIIALPIPDESLLVAAGYLVAKGELPAIPILLAAVLGAWFGVTVSYGLGCFLGPYMTGRFGKLLGLSESRLQAAQRWFQRIGKWSLVIGYFIPGVRHLVGYIAGTLGFPYRRFAVFAYTGSAVWANLFLGGGYLLYQQGGSLMASLQAKWLMLFG